MKKILGLLVVFAGLQLSYGQITVYIEDFQGGIPATFTLINNDGLTPAAAVSEFTEAWITKEDPDAPGSGDSVAATTSYFDPAGTADRWLITPQINLGAYGNFLYWEAKSHDASFPDGYQVLISTTDTQISSFDTLHTVVIELDIWDSRSLNLSDYGYNSTSVYIAFADRTHDGFKLYIDNISVDIQDPVGLEEKSLSPVVVFPNPCTDILHIEADGLVQVAIRDISGGVIYSGKESSINTQMFASGVYLVEVMTDSGTIVRKITKN